MLKEQVSQLWPGWEVVRIIGRGNFGAVYEIRRETFGHTETAALKVITIPQNESDIDDLYSDGHTTESITMRFQNYLEDIVREYNLMVDMKGHPNVVYCDDLRYIQHEDGIGWNIYIKMELLTPLVKHVAVAAQEEQVIRLGKDICSALMLCKEMKIVHRDIKPQNIFVSRTGQYKLGDFGIAKTAERTTGGTKIGTYKYMAPEVYHNRPYGSGADIYSLGLVLYWLLNERRTPFQPLDHIPTATEEEAARRRRQDGEPLPAPAHGSEELKKIVLKACAYEPKDRFASAEEMLRALEALERGASVQPEVEVEPVPAPVPKEEPKEEPTPVPVPVPKEDPKPAPKTEPVAEPEPAPAPKVEAEPVAAEVCEDEDTVFPADVDLTDEEPTVVEDIAEEKADKEQPEVARKKKKGKKSLLIAAAIAAVLVVLTVLIVTVPRVRFAMLSFGDNTVMLDTTRNQKLEFPAFNSTVVLYRDGHVGGEFGVQDTFEEIRILSVGWYHMVGVKEDGTIVSYGNNAFGPCDVGGWRWRNVVDITCGDKCTIGLTADGEILVAGEPSWWQRVLINEG